MRILLVKAPFSRLLQNSVYFTYPLGLMYVAGMLKQRGHQVHIYHDDVSNPDPIPNSEVLLDQPVIAVPTAEMCIPFEAALDELEPDVVGFSYCTADAVSARHFARLARQRGLRTVAGGPHPSAMPEAELLTGLFDVAVVGEGDSREAARAFEGPCSGILRIPPVEDLNAVRPDRECVIGGQAFTPWWRGMIETQRGCPNACAFCAAPLVFGTRVRRRDSALVREEIEALDVTSGFIVDDCLTANRDHLFGLCRELAKIDYIWWCHAAFQDTDEQVLDALVAGGCIRPGFGYESASERWRALCGKRIDPDHAEDVVRGSIERGMQTVVFFMVGFPGESTDELWATLDCARRLKDMGALPCISVVAAYPKTKLADTVNADGLAWTDYMHQSRRRAFADCTDEEWSQVVALMHEINKGPVEDESANVEP